jgi:hypothetical protein
MAHDDSGQTDEVETTVSGDTTRTAPGPDRGSQPDPIPDRPAKSASADAWADYVVALGAGREFVTGDTEHYDAQAGEVVTVAALKKPELIELADRLGG